VGLKHADTMDKILAGILKDPIVVVPTLTIDTETIAASPPEAVPAVTDALGPRTHVPVARSEGRTVLTPSQIVNNILKSLAKKMSEQYFY
jgi:hypothetical protein